jgi:SAM-dependent methyltransferase
MNREACFQFPTSLSTTILERLPSINGSIGTRERYAKMAELLLQENPHPVVLIVGGSIIGYGMKEFLEHPDIRFVETDITFGPRTQIICDSHDIPFQDNTFDGVVAQAVLEHVVDPHHCVAEIHRVLKNTGIVYAETPFMQQVHGGRYDFLRFTYLGYRRLFRHFAEIESGVVCGPGMALAWSWTYFALSMTTTRIGRAIAYAVTSLSSFWLKYLDKYLIKKPGAFDAASGYYIMARRSEETLSDRDLIQLYRGGHR